ncbi:MAG TPA: hypothetical protein VFR41_12955 [Acidimicrobiia bacterium]|nr:hypothetical protein [Acidimicrobiia bacterium]
MIGFWIVLVALYASHAIELASDSINNHVHVWWIADRLWHHGRIPWHMPILGHGDAFTYPYGVLNWTTAALFWPLFGNWTVTLWSIIGSVGCLIATFVAFPELRDDWWAVAVLANSALIESLLFAQQSFAWGAALLLFAMAAWRRGHRALAAVLAGLGMLNHAAVVAPISLVLVLLYLPFTQSKGALVRWYALACAMAIPAALVVFASPGYADSSSSSRMLNFWITAGQRVLIVVLPVFYALLKSTKIRALAFLAVFVSFGFNIGFEAPLNVIGQWKALFTRSANTHTLDSYLHGPAFVRGATYRVLRGGDAKLGLYHVVQAGGRLDSELFPESMAIRSFRDVDEYEGLLCDRHVDQVLDFDTYDRSRHTNEHALLEQLADGASRRTIVHRLVTGTDFMAYGIDRTRC